MLGQDITLFILRTWSNAFWIFHMAAPVNSKWIYHLLFCTNIKTLQFFSTVCLALGFMNKTFFPSRGLFPVLYDQEDHTT